MKHWLFFLFTTIISFCLHADPLPAQQVFQLQVKRVDPNNFVIEWQIKPDYFLYSDRITLKSLDAETIHLGTLRFPPALIKKNKQGDQFSIYRHHVSLPVAVLGNKSGKAQLELRYQGCSDAGFCYPPEKKRISLAITDTLELSNAVLESDIPSAKTANKPNPVSDVALSHVFEDHNWGMILLIFFGIGLLLSFTPCILPMVPILSGIIVGHGKTVTTRKAFFLSLSYVLSMALTYATVGAVVALLGANLQISMQSPFVITGFSIFFILLALSMFGFYEFKLPDFWQKKIAGSGQKQRGGHYIGAALMGCLSTLIVSPCVTAPLIGVLTYIAQTGNTVLGCLTLFFLGLGMGTPLLLIGTSAGKWLPRSGSWMLVVKSFFGILMLAVAIYLMARILPAIITMMLWASLLVYAGIYAGALTYASTGKEKFCQAFGILCLGYGLIILIGAGMGNSDPLQPLTPPHAAISDTLPKHQNLTLDQIKNAIAQAKGYPVLLDFYADWCASCKVMARSTFKDKQIQDVLERFKIIKVNITANDKSAQEIMAYFKIIAPPAFVFYDRKGNQLTQLKSVGESSVNQFLQILEAVEKASSIA